MKEYSAMASIYDGELKCACKKETCLTCECRKLFKCVEAKVTIIDESEETPIIINLSKVRKASENV